MKRSPLKRGKPLRKASKKRAKELRQYTSLRKNYLTFEAVCEVCKSSSSTDIHHRAGRNGKFLNDCSLWLAVCRTCHDWIHRHPAEARKQGYLV